MVAHASLTGAGDGNMAFLAVGPAGLKIEGSTKEFSASEAGGVLTITVPLKKLETGISLRDSHLQKALNSDKHPNAKLVVKRADLKFPADGKKVEASAKGTFEVNGSPQPMSFNYKVERTGSDYHVQGLATVDILKHKMEKPCYLGVCVDKDVKVKVKFKLREK
jgi:polyisoprenoid-binding protein YceI